MSNALALRERGVMTGRFGARGEPPILKVCGRAFFCAVALALLSMSPVHATNDLDVQRDAVEVAARPTGDIPSIRDTLPRRSNDLVLRMQKGLSALGLYKGPIDGRLNYKIRAAVRAYQGSINLRVNGRITRPLVEGLENKVQIGLLLKRLDTSRIANMSAARKALLSHPATRDLVTNVVDDISDPTRDATFCFDNVTVRCLLDEAIQSGKAVFKPELRDWALGEILVAQARAGLGEAAMETVSRISDPRLIMIALRDIAEAQAASGRNDEALSAVTIIPDPRNQSDALAAIADIQIRRGDLDAAQDTASCLFISLEKIPDILTQISFQTRVAVILAKAGDPLQAVDILTDAENIARNDPAVEDKVRSIALRYVANALAETAHLPRAMDVLNDVAEGSNRTPVLITAATQQAKAGDAAAALATASSIEEVRFRSVVLGKIAHLQAKSGDFGDAEVTLNMALAGIEKIKLPFAHSYAISRVSLSMASIGKMTQAKVEASEIFEKAVEMARKIDDTKLRAHTLWTIFDIQRRAGDREGAVETKRLAQRASGEIKSALSKVWMFSEIASGHATTGAKSAAWTAFARGLKIAKNIENSWGRARALGKLAATLIILVDPGTGHAPKPW